jgi:hypothetical protein
MTEWKVAEELRTLNDLNISTWAASPPTSEIDKAADLIERIGFWPFCVLAILLVVLYLSKNQAPKMIDAWTEAKKREQEAFLKAQEEEQASSAKRQAAYEAQSASMIELATKSEIALNKMLEVVQHNSEVLSATTQTLSALAADIEAHDRRAEDINVGVKQVLEHLR